MSQQIKCKDEIIKELQDILDEDMPGLLEVIRNLKAGKKKVKKKGDNQKREGPPFGFKKYRRRNRHKRPCRAS